MSLPSLGIILVDLKPNKAYMSGVGWQPPECVSPVLPPLDVSGLTVTPITDTARYSDHGCGHLLRTTVVVGIANGHYTPMLQDISNVSVIK